MNPLERLKRWVSLAERQRVLLNWWVDLARKGHFGERFAMCALERSRCDCIVCTTEKVLASTANIEKQDRVKGEK